MAQTKKRKVVKMKRKVHYGTGLLLIFFSAYLLVMLYQSLTKEHVSIYEVTEKKIADDNTVRGVILREEKLYKADQTGYINYYLGEGSKAGRKTTVYSIDQSGQIYDKLSSSQNTDVTLSSQDTEDIRGEIAAYQDAYSPSHYEEIYNFKYSLDNTISEMFNTSLMNSLTQILKMGGQSSDFKLVRSKQAGIVSYTSDGMEKLEMNDVTKATFENTTDNLTQLRQAGQIEQGSPVYRLVTSENWSVIVPLSKVQFKNIQQKDRTAVYLKKISAKVSPQITTFTMDGGYYAKLDLNRYMIQYLNNRYIDIEIEMNDDDGLKIPLTSILKKKFYRIPSEYVSLNQQGQTVLNVVTYDASGNAKVSQENATVIKESDEEKKQEYCYIDPNQIKGGTMISLGDGSDELYQIADSVTLDGVYCSNNGYCEFRRVEKIYQNAEYCIVSKDTDGGLSAYDHIILNPKLINENEIIY